MHHHHVKEIEPKLLLSHKQSLLVGPTRFQDLECLTTMTLGHPLVTKLATAYIQMFPHLNMSTLFEKKPRPWQIRI